jgi:biotin carboxyl carrier protein
VAAAGTLMRRYTVAIDDRTFTIDVSETGSDSFAVSVEGRTFQATLTGDRDLPGVAISPGIAASPGLQSSSSGGGSPAPDGHARRDAVPEAGPIPPPARGSRAVLAAPMPGVVLNVLVAEGAVVRRGDPILVLEAMKMRNTIRAPRDATVVEVVARPGASVAAGAPLVRFGAPPG